MRIETAPHQSLLDTPVIGYRAVTTADLASHPAYTPASIGYEFPRSSEVLNMARVADYSIITDGVMDPGAKKFTVPNNIHTGSRSVLRFKIKARGHDLRDIPFGSFDGMTTKVKLNGTTVWNWDWTNNINPTRVFQEVVSAGIVKPGENFFDYSVEFNDDDGGLPIIEISDAVLWWQANI